MEFMSSKGVARLLNLRDEPRPAQIVQLQAEIKGKTDALVVSASVTGRIDEDRAREIVLMKLELDRLVGQWAEGELV